MSPSSSPPLVAVLMGSDSDWPTMKAASEVCARFGIAHESRVLSAHRTPVDMARFGAQALERGLKVLIAGAGGAAHLPGMLASHTTLPVIGVPVESRSLGGMDSLLSIVQMPRGVPVATVAIGSAQNAGLLAVSILALSDPGLSRSLIGYRREMEEESRGRNKSLE